MKEGMGQIKESQQKHPSKEKQDWRDDNMRGAALIVEQRETINQERKH